MTDRIYVTYSPTTAPESYHAAIHYERTDAAGKVIQHSVVEAKPERLDQLSALDKALGVIEEAFRDDNGASRFGNIRAAVRDANSQDQSYPYENIAEGEDLSSNFTKMLLFAHGVNRAGFAYRGDHQNSNSFASAALHAGGLPSPTAVAHDPTGQAGELFDFFAPGLNEPLRAPIGSNSSDAPIGPIGNDNGNWNSSSGISTLDPTRPVSLPKPDGRRASGEPMPQWIVPPPIFGFPDDAVTQGQGAQNRSQLRGSMFDTGTPSVPFVSPSAWPSVGQRATLGNGPATGFSATGGGNLASMASQAQASPVLQYLQNLRQQGGGNSPQQFLTSPNGSPAPLVPADPSGEPIGGLLARLMAVTGIDPDDSGQPAGSPFVDEWRRLVGGA